MVVFLIWGQRYKKKQNQTNSARFFFKKFPAQA
jgi:hypothetical protein